MRTKIPVEVKRKCCELAEGGKTSKWIYDKYFSVEIPGATSYETFRQLLLRWKKKTYPDSLTLERGTYEGFIAHNATVQVSKTGEITQAWIKQTASDFDMEDFLSGVRSVVEPFEYEKPNLSKPYCMLEIPLFDMHWGVAFMDHYRQKLNDILDIINSREWHKIVIPFGQDFFHNDSIVNGITTKGTLIEKVDMIRAVKEGKQFIYTIIDAALNRSKEVKVLYTPGNHDKSISWMFMQVLLERYGADIVDDSLENRKVITYGQNSILVTHGDSKQATPKNLAHIFPIAFPEEFAKASVREVHAGHLHHESEADIYGVMVRRLSTGAKTDDWHDKEDYVGTHRRFMVFEWGLTKLKSIHYI